MNSPSASSRRTDLLFGLGTLLHRIMDEMGSNPEKLFRKASGEVPAGTTLKLLLSPDERSSDIAHFAAQLRRWIPQLSIVRARAPAIEFPSMLLPNGVRYQGIPQGNEAGPFMDALSGKIPPLADRLRERLGAAALQPAVLDLFVTVQCPFCPGVVRELMPLAEANRFIRLTVIDTGLFPELAGRHRILAAPTLVVDGQFRWTGSIVLEEVVACMVTRDASAMGPAALEQMLREGAAQRLARMMAEQNKVFPAILDLLCHAEWPVRLGAMVTVEELIALAPHVGQQVLDAVWNRFDTVSDPVRGDILFLCGESGNPSLAPRIQAVLKSGATGEVKAAAAEALEKLR